MYCIAVSYTHLDVYKRQMQYTHARARVLFTNAIPTIPTNNIILSEELIKKLLFTNYLKVKYYLNTQYYQV